MRKIETPESEARQDEPAAIEAMANNPAQLEKQKEKYESTETEVEKFLDQEAEILAAYGLRGDITLERSNKGWAFDFENKRLLYDPNFFVERGYSLKETLFATTQVINGQYAEFLKDPELVLQENRRNTTKLHIQLLHKTILNILGGHRAVSAMPFLEDTQKELGKMWLSTIKEKDEKRDPLHIQFIKEILSEEMTKETLPVSQEVQETIKSLRHFGKEGDDVLNLVLAPSLSPRERFEIIKKIIEPAYLKLYKKDLDDASKGRDLFEEIDNDLPPEEQDEYYPRDIESQESKEKPPHIFMISPGIAGYYSGGIRNIFDQKTLRWRKEKKLSSYSNRVANSPHEYRGKILGNIALPLPRGFAIDTGSFKQEGGDAIKVFCDQFGAFYASSQKLQELYFRFGKAEFHESSQPNEFLKELFSGQLSNQTETELKSNKKLKTAEEQADHLVRFIRKKYKYDVKAQGSLYKNSENTENYFKNIDASKISECYTANTFFVSLCRKLGIPARLIIGHHISSLDTDGSAKITRNTGHAWAEIWNGTQWILYDATPPADGNDFKENQNALNDAMPNPLPQKDKERMEKDIKEFLDKKSGEPSLDRSILEQWAKEHGVSAKDVIGYRNEYQEIMPLIKELREVFKKIVSRRLKERMRLSPQLKREGEEIEEESLTQAYVESKAGGEPRAFREVEWKKREEVGYGMLDMTLVNDLSGSMKGAKLSMDRKSKQLFMESLAAFQKEIEGAEFENGVSLGLEVRTETRAFGDFGDAELKKLSPHLDEKERISVWKKLHQADGGTPDYLSLEEVLKSIDADYEKELRDKKRRKVVVVLSDGESQDPSRVQKALKELRDKGVIVFALGMTESGQAVKNTYYPDAEVIANINKLPQAVQKIILKYTEGL